MITVNAVRADDSIEGLESLCREEHRRAEAADVLWEMQYNVKLRLIEPTWGELAHGI